MGGVVSAGIDNDDLVDKLKEADYIKSISVEKVFRLVDRGYYLTKNNQNVAYRDNAWRSGNLHISAPCIYAQVMEGLKIGPGMSFLNIGSGTGYLSTMAGLLIGPSGINHGVELHSDVVEYARERLNWFLTNTGGVDVSFFCEPQFAQGNALCFGEDNYLYDRVYCGASCPSSHESYMKNLIKVNGVLVMPRNDTLLKITRTSDTTWTSESLLPVSFSSLVMPDQSFTQECTELPAVHMVSLQELAREVIRSYFRSRIEAENEDLRSAFIHVNSSQPTKDRLQGCRPSRTFPNMTISDSEYDSDGSSEVDPERQTIFSMHRLQANQLSAFLELARSLAMNRSAAEEEERHEDQREDAMEREESPVQEAYANEENEDMVVDGEELDLLAMLTSHNGASSTNPRGDEPNEDQNASVEESPGQETQNVMAIVVTTESGTQDVPPPVATSSETTKEKEEEKEQEEEKKQEQEQAEAEAEEGEEKEAKTREDHSANRCSTPLTEDEEMVEVVEVPTKDKKASNGRKSSKKEVKKREKFDSGIVEDIDPVENMDESSSCSFHSRSDNNSSSSSNSTSCSESSDEADEARPGPCRGRPPKGAKCNCGRNGCGSRRMWWRKREINRRRRRTIRCDDSKTDSKELIERFSRLMKEKIMELPLPLLVKVYLNYNRPL